MSRKKPRSSECSGSVSGHQAGKDGMCTWGCGTRVSAPVPKPRTTGQTDLGQEYRRHYDPDYGSEVDDT